MKIAIFVGLTLGNFVLQALGDQLWAVATERSFFQAVALFSVWLVTKAATDKSEAL